MCIDILLNIHKSQTHNMLKYNSIACSPALLITMAGWLKRHQWKRHVVILFPLFLTFSEKKSIIWHFLSIVEFLIQTWRKGKNDELRTRGNIMVIIIINVAYYWRALTLLPPPKKKFFRLEIVPCYRRYFLRFTIAGGLVDLPLWISTPH